MPGLPLSMAAMNVLWRLAFGLCLAICLRANAEEPSMSDASLPGDATPSERWRG